MEMFVITSIISEIVQIYNVCKKKHVLHTIIITAV